MISRASLTRRLRHLRRSVEEPLGFHDLVDLEVMAGALCRWGASLPWAEERSYAGEGKLGCAFVIECPPLACSGAWFTVHLSSDDLDDGPEVRVMLPTAIARRGVLVGWAAGTIDLAADRSLVTVPLPTTASELTALQHLLQVAYVAAFTDAGDGR
jgi:hypothetical protein